MKNRNNPTLSQYSYMVTGLLSAEIQRNGIITEDDVKKAVLTAKMAYELISDVVSDTEDDHESKPQGKIFQEGGSPLSRYMNTTYDTKEKEPMQNYFQEYEWKNGKATWSELNAWLKKQGITSNRRISNIFRESIDKGYIRKDENTRQYLQPLP